MRLFKIDIGYLFIVALCMEEFIRNMVTKSTFDIHSHDTMYVVSKSTWWKIMVLYFVLAFAANRHLARISPKSKRFQWVVLIVTFFSAVVVNILVEVGDRFRSSLTFDDFARYNKIISLISVFFLIVVVAQLIFWMFYLTTLIRQTFYNKKSF